MRCPTCGFENSGGHRFCGGCGLAVSDTETPELSLQPTLGSGPPPDSQAALAGSESLIANRYRVQRTLGQGGMGAVYLATDTKPGMGGREVAIKRILDADDQGVQRFLRESSTIATLNHQNIRAVHDRGEDDHGHYLVMEYVEGETLHDRVARGGALGDETFLELAQGLAQALAFAHRKGVIHRDVKPANVMFTGDGTPKLTDFGLARMGYDSDLSLTGYGMGTLDYASPEQRRDAKSADHRSDIYGLGATLYFAATGETPKVVRSERIPMKWRSVVLKCLEEKPEHRYFSVDDFLRELEDSSQKGATSAAAPAPQVAEGSFACPSCGHANSAEKKFCLSCGMGLFLTCPKCGGEEREGTRYCGSCGTDIPAWRDAEEHLQAARKHLEAHAFGRAAKEAKLALEAVPGMEAARVLAKEAKQKQDVVRTARETARGFEAEEAFEKAEEPWRDLLGIVPDDEEALQALANHPERIRERDFRRAVGAAKERLAAADLQGLVERLPLVAELAGEADEEQVALLREDARSLRAHQVRQGLTEVEALLEGGRLEKVKGQLTELDAVLSDGGEALGQDSDLQEGLEQARADLRRRERELAVADRAARRRRVLLSAVTALMAVAAALGVWFSWAWRDNSRILSEAEAHIEAGRFEQVEATLGSLHGGIVPVGAGRRDASARRAELWEDLDGRWPGSTLPGDVLAQLRSPDSSESQIRSDFLGQFQAEVGRLLEELESGAWKGRADASSAREAEESSSRFLALLIGSGIPREEAAVLRQRAEGIQSEAREAREASERINPFLAEGWTVEDGTPGFGGHAKKLKDPKTGITFILVEPGEFMMGSLVQLTKPFYLGETEVTQAQWEKMMGNAPSYFKGDTLPVEQVSWNDCQEYLKNAGSGYRLPTEAEWEYACRAGTKTRFHSGNSDFNLASAAWYKNNSGKQTHPVAQRQANAWGFYDMHGNVWEWCADWVGDYPQGVVEDPQGPSSGTFRVLRGGSWDCTPRYCRSAFRGSFKPDYRFSSYGFRVVRTLP